MARQSPLRNASPEPAIAIAILAALLGVYSVTTGHVSANGGLGYDGLMYGRMVATLRGTPLEVWSPYAYRILPAAIVAWSGLEVRLGFYVLNVASILGSGLFLIALLRRYGAPRRARLVAILWWGLLPFTLRFADLYPVLVDGIGLLLLVALLWSAMSDRLVLFALFLVAGVLTRENLLLLAPLPLLRAIGFDRSLRSIAAVFPAAAVLIVAHLWPVITPTPTSESTGEYLAASAAWILTNGNAQAVRLVVSPFFSWGMLLAVVAARPRATLRVFARERGWTYVAAVTLVSAALGGLDHDRYLVGLAPLLLIAAVRVAPQLWASRAMLVAVTIAHAVACRALMPIGSDPASYFDFMIATMSLPALWISACALVLLSAVAAVAIRLGTDRSAEQDHRVRVATPQLTARLG